MLQCCMPCVSDPWLAPGCELDRFLTEFEFELKRHSQVRVQGFLFFEFKFEFGKNDLVRVQVHSPVQKIPLNKHNLTRNGSRTF